jgi:hypothetical protein
MNTSVAFPSTLHWDARQLADAVPPRLFEAIDFDFARRPAAATAARHAPRAWRGAYHANPPLPARIDVCH